MQFFDLFTTTIDSINDWIGKILSLLALLIFVILLCEVVLRYFFNSPTIWVNESTQLLFGAYAVLSGGYVLRWDGHVNVDFLYGRFSSRGKAIADIATSFLLFVFVGSMLYYGCLMAFASLSRLEHSHTAWNPPLYPFKLMIPLGALLVLLQGIAKLLRDILRLRSGECNNES